MRRLMEVLKADFRELYGHLMRRFYQKRRLNAAKKNLRNDATVDAKVRLSVYI